MDLQEAYRQVMKERDFGGKPPLNRFAAIVGAGQTGFGDYPEVSAAELFAEAYQEAAKSVDSGFEDSVIEAMYIGHVGIGGCQIGNVSAALADCVGLTGIPSFRVENACASSGFALLSAVQGILSSQYDVVVAGGVEKMRDIPLVRARNWLEADVEHEKFAGITFAGLYALMATRYMHEYNVEKKYLSMVSVKNHRHAAQNPKAQFRREITLDEALNSPSIAYPLNLYDTCPTSDGASAVIVVNAKLANKFTDTPIYIMGVGAGTDTVALSDREEITNLKATREAARQAYKSSGVKPKDIDVAEVHDCFTIAELMAYEDLGFADKGLGWTLVRDDVTSLAGRIPVNASGGLKAKGHPIGATGTGQTYEIFNQLRGTVERHSRQVKDPEIGLSHNLGGSGATATVFIYGR